jgi:hypothetical protein
VKEMTSRNLRIEFLLAGLVMLVSAAMAYSCNNSYGGVGGWWTMNETVPELLTMCDGNATTNVGAILGASGHFDRSAYFLRANPTVGDYINLYSYPISGTDATITAWVALEKPALGNGAYHGILGAAATNGSKAYGLSMFVYDTVLDPHMGDSATQYLSATLGNGTINSGLPVYMKASGFGVPQFVAVVKNATHLKFYVDGTSTVVANADAMVAPVSGVNYSIGRLGFAGSYLNGYIDEVTLWSAALPDDVIYSIRDNNVLGNATAGYSPVYGANTSNISFMAYEGSSNCSSGDFVPGINCVINASVAPASADCDGMSFWLQMEESTGTAGSTLVDRCGGNNFTRMAYTKQDAGAFGYGQNFSAAYSPWALASDNASALTAGSRSWRMVYRPTDFAATHQDMSDNETGAYSNFGLSYGDFDWLMRCACISPLAGVREAIGTTTMLPGGSYDLLCVYDMDDFNNISIYMNGTLEASSQGFACDAPISQGGMIIGFDPPAVAGYPNGVIDEAFYLKRAVTPAEAALLFSNNTLYYTYPTGAGTSSVYIPASGSTTFSNYSGYPAFASRSRVTEQCYSVNQAPYSGAWTGMYQTGSLRIFQRTNDAALFFYPAHSPPTGDPALAACTNSRHEQLSILPGQSDVVKMAWVGGYLPPNGNVRNIDLSAINFDTSLITTGLKTNCDYCAFGVCTGCPSYNITWVAGVNSTHFKKTNVTVGNNGMTVKVAYGTDLAALLDTENQRLAADVVGMANRRFSMDTIPYGYKYMGNRSVWIDYDENWIGRFSLLWIYANPGTSPLFEGDITVADDSGFNMSYNATYFNASYGYAAGYPYGLYDYECAAPSGYMEFNGSLSGSILLDQPQEYVTVYLQKTRPLRLELKVKYSGAPAVGAVCKPSVGTPPIISADANGICNITNLMPYANLTIPITYAKKTVSFFAGINDYYNSLGWGDGENCEDFDGGYEFTVDVSKENAQVSAQVHLISTMTNIEGAEVYWDGELKGVSDEKGLVNFDVPWNFSKHQLQAKKYGFNNNTIYVDLADGYTYGVALTALSTQAKKEAEGYQAMSSSAGVLGFVANPTFLGIIVVALASVGGAEAGGLVSGVFCAVVSSFLMMMLGYFPFAYFAVIFALSALLGAAGARDTVTGMLKGK